MCSNGLVGMYSKLRNMAKGFKHVEAAPLFDKIIFNKVKDS